MTLNGKTSVVLCALLVAAGVASETRAESTYDISGQWTCNYGKVRTIPVVTPGNWSITVSQSGAEITLTDETGRRSRGSLSYPDVISATDWKYGAKGYLGINVDGTFIRYSEAIERFNIGADQRWNFIRWDSGALCVNPALR